jgi:hypothetical protein
VQPKCNNEALKSTGPLPQLLYYIKPAKATFRIPRGGCRAGLKCAKRALSCAEADAADSNELELWRAALRMTPKIAPAPEGSHSSRNPIPNRVKIRQIVHFTQISDSFG